MRAVFATKVALLLVVFGGCGGNTPSVSVSTTPVKGKVTYKGQPLTGGTISFEPENSGREAFGDIKSDGTFELTTYKPGDGAVVGSCRVQVVNPGKAGKQAVPGKFKNYSSSKITVDVTTDKSDYTIDLK